jgi:hypothetical protein
VTREATRSHLSLSRGRLAIHGGSAACSVAWDGRFKVNDHLDFSPLSDAERESANEWVHKTAPKADRPMPPPANAEAPEMAAARLFSRPPDALWPYTEASGAVLFWICRWTDMKDGEGSKELRPLCWFVDRGYRFAHWPAPRPLYNVDKIQSNPSAQVVVCEGEKAADAASRIFPDSIATTSCGGAEATHLTDWAPLECRQVLIWPDNDRAAGDGAGLLAFIVGLVTLATIGSYNILDRMRAACA